MQYKELERKQLEKCQMKYKVSRIDFLTKYASIAQ